MKGMHSFQNSLENSNKKNNKYMNLNKKLTKEEMAFFDVVEQKDIDLKNLKNETKNIKKETIKEFVYSNKKIPDLWKNKKNFKNIVLETFVEDNHFLNYLGTVEDSESIQFKKKTLIRPKTTISEGKKIIPNLKKNKPKYFNNYKNKLSLGSFEPLKTYSNSISNNIYSLSTSNKYKKPKIKLRKIFSQQEEIQNMLDNLKEKYPLRTKLKELYENDNLEEINVPLESNKNDNKENNKTINVSSVENLVDKSRLHKIQKIERNIFNNLLSLNKKNIPNKYKEFFDENIFNKNSSNKDYYKLSRILIKKKKEKIKNELNDSIIFNHLKSTNFYGPYFSYCPYCCNNNIKYYKHMERKQCISLLNFIKKDRSKKMEIEESKFRERVKMDKNSILK